MVDKTRGGSFPDGLLLLFIGGILFGQAVAVVFTKPINLINSITYFFYGVSAVICIGRGLILKYEKVS